MKLKLGIVFTNNKLPKTGYLAFVDDQLYRITSTYIADDGIEFANMISIFDNSPYVLSTIEIQDKYIKFIAIHEKVMYSIIHGDYNDIISKIKLCSSINYLADDIVKDIIENKFDILIDGFIKKIYCKVNETDLVEIIKLEIIDNYKLHEKRNRLFNVATKLEKGINTRYILKKGDIIINTDRDSFKVVGSPNYKSLFTTKPNIK